MTQKIAQSVDVGLHRVLRLAVTDPLPRLVEALNAFQPDVLNAYPSIAVLLADEQLAGRLRIAPSVISTSSELRTRGDERAHRARIGVRAVRPYGTTEGLWGVECDQHDGIHLFEDWCIVENVDEHGRAVPDGEHGERLLVTNLVNRTLPMIRFQISDVVALDRRPCACGRTLPRLRAAHGRLEDVLRLPGSRGEAVPVHPAQFSTMTGDPAVREFQVQQRGPRILLRLALHDGAPADTPERIARTVTERLRALGVDHPAVTAEVTDSIARSPAGKLRLVVPDPTADAPSTAQPPLRLSASSAAATSEQLRAGELRAPLLVLLGGPAALVDQQLPEVGVVDRPEDVGRAFHVEARAERRLVVQALDDQALVGVELALDAAPERADVGVDRSGAADDLEHARRSGASPRVSCGR